MGCCLALVLALAWDGLSENSATQSVAGEIACVANSAKGGFLACLVKKGMTPEQVQKILGPHFEVNSLGMFWHYSGGVTVTFSHRWINDEAKVVNVQWQPPWHCCEPVEDLRDNRGWERMWYIEEPAKR